MKYTRKLGAGLGALLAVGGIGALGISQAAEANTTVMIPAAKVTAITPSNPAAGADTGPDVQQGGNTQVGDQSGPDTVSATKGESPEVSGAESPEKAGAEADGPGGHQDAPGAAGADTQQ